jgi:hypothetical protein
MCPSINNSGNYQISGKNSEFFVSIVPLQEIIDSFDIKIIKLLKIDIEGYELFAYKGINWDNVNIENIVMEYIPEHLGNQHILANDCLQFLINKGYKPYNIYGDKYDFSGSLPESNLWLKKIL